MASRFGYSMNYRSLGERTYSGKQILMGLIGIVVAGGLIAGGVIIIDDQKKLKELDNTKTSELYSLLAFAFIIAGSVLVLFGLFKFFTKAD